MKNNKTNKIFWQMELINIMSDIEPRGYSESRRRGLFKVCDLFEKVLESKDKQHLEAMKEILYRFEGMVANDCGCGEVLDEEVNKAFKALNTNKLN